eukprot:jgi/Psemu1/294997/fgenesh1_pm.39_\
MVDRGKCTFVKKALHAQKLGAAAMIIADTTCLYEVCESKGPIMTDDGSGYDVTIPSFLMYKQDADPVKEALKQNQVVSMTISWPRPDSHVEYSIWTTPSDKISIPLQREFRHVALALGENATFTPRMYMYDGAHAGCLSPTGENQCDNLCTNNGKYCSTDPEDDLGKGISGADVIVESLRRIYGIGMPWWDYVDEFLYRCNTEEFFSSEDCVKNCMKRAEVDYSKIKICMDDSGGVEADAPNTLLDKELAAKAVSGVAIVPSFYVNNAPHRGAPKTAEILEAICAGYALGQEPHVCKTCVGCDDVVICATENHCSDSSDDGVSIKMFAGTLVGVVIFFYMRTQISGIMAEYMPIDKKQKVEMLGIPEDDNLHIEFS